MKPLNCRFCFAVPEVKLVNGTWYVECPTQDYRCDHAGGSAVKEEAIDHWNEAIKFELHYYRGSEEVEAYLAKLKLADGEKP